MNGYIAFYRGKRVEVWADTKLAAQRKAAELLKARKPWDVVIELAELDGKPVVHNATE